MKKRIKKILLAGLGAEIGSMLLSMNDPKKDNLLIDTVIIALLKYIILQELQLHQENLQLY